MSIFEKFIAALILFMGATGLMGCYVMQYKLDAAEKSVQLYLSQIEQQNMAIDNLERQSQMQINLQKQRDKQAKADADTYAKEVRQLMQAKVPTECADAMHWLAHEGQGMKPQ